MPDKFTAICPKCGKKKQVLLKHAGRQAECKCGARFRLEEAVAYSAAQEEEARKQTSPQNYPNREKVLELIQRNREMIDREIQNARRRNEGSSGMSQE